MHRKLQTKWAKLTLAAHERFTQSTKQRESEWVAAEVEDVEQEEEDQIVDKEDDIVEEEPSFGQHTALVASFKTAHRDVQGDCDLAAVKAAIEKCVRELSHQQATTEKPSARGRPRGRRRS
jgi:hypothetical protein